MYRKFDDLGNAMRCALKLNNMDTIQEIFTAASKKGSCIQRQLAYLLGKQGVVLPNDEEMADEDLTEMLWNTRLSEHFLSLGCELDIMEPKVSLHFLLVSSHKSLLLIGIE